MALYGTVPPFQNPEIPIGMIRYDVVYLNYHRYSIDIIRQR